MTIMGSESWGAGSNERRCIDLGYMLHGHFSESWMPVGTLELFRELERIGGSTRGAGHG